MTETAAKSINKDKHYKQSHSGYCTQNCNARNLMWVNKNYEEWNMWWLEVPHHQGPQQRHGEATAIATVSKTSFPEGVSHLPRCMSTTLTWLRITGLPIRGKTLDARCLVQGAPQAAVSPACDSQSWGALLQLAVVYAKEHWESIK